MLAIRSSAAGIGVLRGRPQSSSRSQQHRSCLLSRGNNSSGVQPAGALLSSVNTSRPAGAVVGSSSICSRPCSGSWVAQAAAGGGAGSISGSGGSGGAGGSSGSSGSSSSGDGSSTPHPLRLWTFLYAAFLAVGGVAAYMTKSSTKSLTSAGGSAVILALSARTMVGAQAKGSIGVCLALALLLSVVMAGRFSRTRKVMPAGLTAGLSLGMSVAYIAALFA